MVCKVVELDFLYPSEGIHRRWESGFRITSMAATADQAALILSIPKRKITDETQETLRTSAFPSTHVKVWFFSHNCFKKQILTLDPSPVVLFHVQRHDSFLLLVSGKMDEKSVPCINMLWSDRLLSFSRSLTT